MRVAIVTESFLPSANGVTTSVLRVLDHLDRAGHEALVVCPSPAPTSYGSARVVPVPAVPWRGFAVGVPVPALRRAVLDFAPDVIHAASPFCLGAQALALANRENIPSVAVFQTDVAGFARRSGLRLAAPAAWSWLRAIHDLADRTLAPTAVTLAELRARGFSRVAVWGRGVDTRAFHPNWRTSSAGRQLRRRLAPDGEFVIGYVGRLAPEKRVERLRVLTGEPELRLMVAGDGPSRGSVEQSLGADATLLGRLDGPALSIAYAACDVFVHTGTEETFGQTLQEAMASGVPVVAPRAGGPIDIVAESETGLLYEPEDDDDLRGCVTGLLADSQLRARMGEAARRFTLTRSWDSICEELIEHYRSVATTHIRRGTPLVGLPG